MAHVDVILNSFPPYTSQSPMPAMGYLRGYLGRHVPEAEVKTHYWNQSILLECLAAEWRLLPETYMKQNCFYGALFSWLYYAEQFDGEYDSAFCDYIEAYGALYLRDKSKKTFRRICGKVGHFVRSLVESEAEIKSPSMLVGASVLFNQEMSSLYYLKLMKQINPKATTFLGGMTKRDTALFMKSFPFIDLCIYGEGEVALAEVCRWKSGGQQLENIGGLAFRRDGQIITNEPMAPLTEVDDVWADYTGFDWKAAQMRGGQITLPIWDARGCSWNRCHFCNLNKISSCYRERSPESIVSEIQHHLMVMGAQPQMPVGIQFLSNDAHGQNKKRFLTLLEELENLKKEQRQLSVFMELSPVHMDETAAKKLNNLSAGIQFGFEQWNSSVRRMNKGHRIEHGIATLKLVEKYPLIKVLGMNILVGYPGEQVTDVYEAYENMSRQKYIWRNLVNSNRMNDFYAGNLVVYPGTRLSEVWADSGQMPDRYQKNRPMTQILARFCGDESLAVDYMQHTEGLYLYDISHTAEVGKQVYGEFFDGLKHLKLEYFTSEDQTLSLVSADLSGKRVITLKGLSLAILKATKGIITKKDLMHLLSSYSAEEIENAIALLVDKEWLYVSGDFHINTLPSQLQHFIDTGGF